MTDQPRKSDTRRFLRAFWSGFFAVPAAPCDPYGLNASLAARKAARPDRQRAAKQGRGA